MEMDLIDTKAGSPAAGTRNFSTIKAFEIIECLANHNNEPQRLQDLAEKLSMNTSTVLRFLNSLKNCGYVQQDNVSLRYSLTLKLCALANKISSNIRLFEIAKPVMSEISDLAGETVCLAIEQDDSVVYIGSVQNSSKILSTMQRIGNRAPMHCTGIGKVLLMDKSPQEIRQFISQTGLVAFTRHTITSEDQLLEELQKVKTNGHAFDNEECEIGARCVSLPVRDYTGKVVAGISITGTVYRLSDEKIRAILPAFKEKADQISRLLGYEER